MTNGKRYKTVEIIVDEIPWIPRSSRRRPARSADDMVGLRINYRGADLREAVKRAGGIWRAKQKLWGLPCRKVVALGIEDRIVED
jgi:hypothetical protein